MADEKVNTPQEPEVAEESPQEEAEEMKEEVAETEEAEAEETAGMQAGDDALRAALESAEKERDQYKDALIHERADFENYKKRNASLEQAAFDRGAENVITRILPVLDNFERALAADTQADKFAEGMQMIMRQLTDELAALGVREVDTSGEFDPAMHHAVMQTELDDVESNHISETLQKGYLLHDRVIRPAMVKVNK